MAAAATASEIERNRFGTFGGVFTPTLLTILGVVLFMLSNYVVGHGGIINALLILLFAKSIVLMTSLSISAISTNTRVRGGGAYFLISRSLGPEFGGAIGLTLFFAQALSVPFYILGFVKALTSTFPSIESNFVGICLITAGALFLVAYVGAEWAIRVQYVVLAVLLLAIASFLVGAALEFDIALFRENLGRPAQSAEYNISFWVLFALYFPAVTGIMTGVNMSGDLEDPARSIPRGTLYAVAIAAVVYTLQAILCGGALPRGEMMARPYESLVALSLFGMGFVVAAGVFAATISSAIGSFVAAPRVLQALARDDILPPVRAFSHGTTKGDEPRRAMWLTLGVTLTVIMLAGGAGGDGLNQVAAVVSMFFLAAYGVTNWAAFVEAVGANPSFRPRFRFFHWSAAMLGAVGCAGVALLIDPVAAVAACGVIAIIYYYVRRRDLETGFGDARRGYVYTRARNNLLRLQELPADPKNWRPTVLVLSGNPETRLTQVQYALWLEAGRGVVSLVELLIGDVRELGDERREAQARLKQFVNDEQIPIFVEATVVPDFDEGLRVVLQTHSIGPLKANLIMFGWSVNADRAVAFSEHLHTADDIGMSLLVLADRGLPTIKRSERRIDVWWRGRENGSLMLVLAHLIRSGPDWARSRLRILRLASEEARESAASELHELVDAGRMSAEVEIIVSDLPFAQVLHEASADATLVLLGFSPPPAGSERAFAGRE